MLLQNKYYLSLMRRTKSTKSPLAPLLRNEQQKEFFICKRILYKFVKNALLGKLCRLFVSPSVIWLVKMW